MLANRQAEGLAAGIWSFHRAIQEKKSRAMALP